MATLTDYTTTLTRSVQEDYPIKTVTDAMTVKEYTLINDFNDIVIPGLYRTQLPENPLNSIPVGEWGMLRVYDTGAWIRQDYYSDCNSSAWARIYNKGENSWSAWKQTDGQCAITGYWSSGFNFWRTWSDGFIEQGGRTGLIKDYGTATVSLHHSMPNTNYLITLGNMRSGTADDGTWNSAQIINMGTISTTSFQIYSRGASDSGRYFCWYVCGK